MEKLSQKVIRGLIENGNISKEYEAVYQYALQSVLILGINVLLSLLIGILLDRVVSCVVFLCAMIPLRSNAGGYHASNLVVCYILSFASLITTLLLVGKTDLHWIITLAVVAVASTAFIFLYAPLDALGKGEEIRPKGSRNPATGGDACFSVQYEFNGFARQGVLAGTEYERYLAFQDAPAYEKDYATGWKILAGIAVAVVVGVAIGALVFATGGIAAAALGMTAAQLAVGTGVVTAGAGMLATFGTCLNDWRNGTTSSIFDYMGNSYTASVTVGGALEALYLSLAGAEALIYLMTGGSMTVPVFGTVISTRGIMAAAMKAAVGAAKLNVGFQLYDLCLFLAGEKPLRAPTGNWLYDTAKAWTETVAWYIALLGLQNPRTYGPTYERLPGAVDVGASGSTALATQNTGMRGVCLSRESWHRSSR